MPTPNSTVSSWTCTAKEQLDQHVSGMLQVLVYPGGERRELSFQLNWADQPGYIAEQQAIWFGIPPDAAQLWKPDKIAFSVDSKRTDERGLVIFDSLAAGQIADPARVSVKSLRPTFPATWVSVDEGYLISKLWAGWPWRAKLIDRKGVTLGTQAILLPRPEVAQAMFARLKAELERLAAEKATKCSANIESEGFEDVI